MNGVRAFLVIALQLISLPVELIRAARDPPRKRDQHVSLTALLIGPAGISPQNVFFTAVRIQIEIPAQRRAPRRHDRALRPEAERDFYVLRFRHDSPIIESVQAGDK